MGHKEHDQRGYDHHYLQQFMHRTCTFEKGKKNKTRQTVRALELYRNTVRKDLPSQISMYSKDGEGLTHE